MKKFFTSLFDKPSQEKTQVIEPKTILFTVPSLSNDIAPLVPMRENPGSKDFGFHEDEWCQIEFFPPSQLTTIQQILREYKRFEQAHRVKLGWDEVYLRKIERIPVLTSPQPVKKLEGVLGVKAGDAPFLFTYGAISGKVINGFTFPLGGNITLYGYVEGDNIPALGAYVGKNSEDIRLTEAFQKLNASDGLLLVDWYRQTFILKTSSDSTVVLWKP